MLRRILKCVKEKKYKVLFLCLMAAIFVFGSIRVYQRVVLPASKKDGKIYAEQQVNKNSLWTIQKNTIYNQDITVDRNGLINILLRLQIKNNEKSKLYVQLRSQGNEIIDEWCMDSKDIKENEYTHFRLKSPLIGKNGQSYSIIIVLSNEIDFSLNKFEDNYKSINGHMQYALQGTGYDFLTKYYKVCVTILVFLVMALFSVMILKKNVKIEWMFVSLSLIFGTCYMIVFPPFTAPDDYAHFVASYQLSERILGKTLPYESEQVAQDVFTCDGYFTRYAKGEGYKYVWDALHGDNGDSAEKTNYLYEFVGATGHYAQALGISLAKVLNLSYIFMIYFGRFFNLLIWTIIGYLIIRIVPFGKNIFLAISCLPMMMELVSSFSRDAYIFELSFLFIAYILYLKYKKENITFLNIGFLSLLLILLLPCKYIYVLMGFLVFLLPLKKIKNKYRYYALIVCTMVILAAQLIFIVIKENDKATNDLSSVTTEAVLGSNTEFYSIDKVIKDPLNTINIFANTLRDKSGFYLMTMLGNKLGSLEVNVSEILIIPFLIILLLSCLKEKNEIFVISNKEKSVFLLVFGFIFMAALGAMLIEWTGLNEDIIGGIQGRYFLPILPLLCFTIRNNTIVLNKNIDRLIWGGSLVLQYFTILYCLEEILNLG